MIEAQDYFSLNNQYAMGWVDSVIVTLSVNIGEAIRVGDETFVASDSPAAEYSVVFEDDGDTGYLYALDTSLSESRILDALHIYNVANVVDKDKPSLVQIEWSEDGLKAALWINGYTHAVFDFAQKRGYCRTNSLSPNRKWTSFSKEWSDAVLESFQ